MTMRYVTFLVSVESVSGEDVEREFFSRDFSPHSNFNIDAMSCEFRFNLILHSFYFIFILFPKFAILF
uniref:Uncharacterized protein n=1 Tax=Strigamia maritima TaxID=126957 RepID=T1J437_STRMM